MDIFIIPGQSLEDFYQDTIDYLNHKFHSYTTCLEPINITETEAADMSYYDSLAQNHIDHDQNPPGRNNRWVS